MSRGCICPGVGSLGVGMSGKVGPQRGGYPPLRYGLQRDTVGKRAVCIILECFLVLSIFLNFKVLGHKI